MDNTRYRHFTIISLKEMLKEEKISAKKIIEVGSIIF